MLKFTPQRSAWDFKRQTVNFQGMADGRAVTCRISLEALQNHFDLHGSDGAAAQEAFESNRQKIEELADLKHQAAALEPDGTILLRSEDF